MDSNFISTTKLQRSTKSVFSNKKPYQIILHNNDLAWILLSKDLSKILIDSGLLDQIKEELYEANDKETVNIIKNHRSGKTKPVAYDEIMKNYE